MRSSLFAGHAGGLAAAHQVLLGDGLPHLLGAAVQLVLIDQVGLGLAHLGGARRHLLGPRHRLQLGQLRLGGLQRRLAVAVLRPQLAVVQAEQRGALS